MAENKKIISQAQAAKTAGVSRQALNGMFKKNSSLYGFFTDDGKVDSSHPHWLSYLSERRNRFNVQQNQAPVINLADNKPHRKNDRDRQDKNSEKSSGKQSNEWSREHSLTGGYDPAQFPATNPSQLKAITDVVRMNLEMRIKLNDFISREIVDQYVGTISQGIGQFVSVSRSVSTDICEKLDRVGMEREVEKIINPKIKNIIEQIIEACNNAQK